MFDIILTRFQSFLVLGGPVVGILLFLSVIALTIVIIKLAQFQLTHVGSHSLARKTMRSFFKGELKTAVKLNGEDKSPIILVLNHGLTLLSRNPHITKTILEDEMSRIANQKLHELRKGVGVLEAIAQIAPLLGLFGTVIGMISAFQKLQEAGSSIDPSLLAGGIWVALMTTAVGLALSMPASLITMWFESKIENERMVIENISTEFVSGIFQTRRAQSAHSNLPDSQNRNETNEASIFPLQTVQNHAS